MQNYQTVVDFRLGNRPKTSSGFQGYKLEFKKHSAAGLLKEPRVPHSHRFYSPYQLLLQTLKDNQKRQAQFALRKQASEYQSPYHLEFDADDNLLIHEFHKSKSRVPPKSQQSIRPKFLQFANESRDTQNYFSESKPIATQTDEEERIKMPHFESGSNFQPRANEFVNLKEKSLQKRCKSSAFWKIEQSMKNRPQQSNKSICNINPILTQISRRLDTQGTISPKFISKFQSTNESQQRSQFATIESNLAVDQGYTRSKQRRKVYSVQSLMKITQSPSLAKGEYVPRIC